MATATFCIPWPRETNEGDRQTTGTGLSYSLTHQSPLGLDQRPVLAVHLVVEAAGVAEVVSVSVPAPQRSGGCSAVDTLAAL